MLLLAFDTATPAVTVALYADTDSTVLAHSTVVDARRHGELLAPGIQQVLDTAGRSAREVTDIAVGVGPGPFTGLRVGLVTALALGDALGARVHGVCTLDVLAEAYAAAGGTGEFAVATDARRREVYWARYTTDTASSAGCRRLTEPAVDRPAVAAEAVGDLPVVGAGSRLYPEQLRTAADPELPDAAVLAELAARRLAAGEPLLEPYPLYLRRPDAVEPGERKKVLPGVTGSG